MFLGEDLLGWLLLALGGAMAVGNLVALVRPPGGDRDAGRAPPPRLADAATFSRLAQRIKALRPGRTASMASSTAAAAANRHEQHVHAKSSCV